MLHRVNIYAATRCTRNIRRHAVKSIRAVEPEMAVYGLLWIEMVGDGSVIEIQMKPKPSDE